MTMTSFNFSLLLDQHLRMEVERPGLCEMTCMAITATPYRYEQWHGLLWRGFPGCIQFEIVHRDSSLTAAFTRIWFAMREHSITFVHKVVFPGNSLAAPHFDQLHNALKNDDPRVTINWTDTSIREDDS